MPDDSNLTNQTKLLSGSEKSKPQFSFGPALLVTAAFIGPGTVLTASKVGADFGYSFLWAVLISVFAAIVLQEMAARLGVISGAGLSDAIRNSFGNPAVRWAMLALVFSAILFGNAAYQTGNLVGAAIGLDVLTGISFEVWVVVIGVVALVVIWVGRFDLLQHLLTALVAIMSLLFIVAVFVCKPDFGAIATGLIPSALPEGAEWKLVGLIGTTVVPYNLFLHASSAAEKWHADQTTGLTDEQASLAVRECRIDTFIALSIGGMITGSILITAAAAFSGQDVKLSNVRDIALQLRPAVGAGAEVLFAIGLMAAGITSAITAPIAAGFAASGCFGWPARLSDWRLKVVATIVVLVGMIVAVLMTSSPAETIIAAQIANGLLLPIVAVFLFISLNRKKLMGAFCNGWLGNTLAIGVILMTIVLAVRQFDSAWDKIHKLFAEYGWS